MTTYQPSRILEEVKNFISYSCRSVTTDLSRADTFYRAIIKKYFNAEDVDIRHSEKEIFMTLQNKKGDCVPVNMDYIDLESFLKSCIEDDLRSLAFYQNMLGYYTLMAKVS